MPTYDHICKSCQHEWEDFYKMADPVPDTCPKCGFQGQVKRLISATPGRVELYGNDLISKLRADGKAEAKAALRSDSKMADLHGLK